MPIFDSQYPVNSNPAGEDKILTTDTSDASAVKSVTLTKVLEWIGSQTFPGPLNVDGDIYSNSDIYSNGKKVALESGFDDPQSGTGTSNSSIASSGTLYSGYSYDFGIGTYLILWQIPRCWVNTTGSIWQISGRVGGSSIDQGSRIDTSGANKQVSVVGFGLYTSASVVTRTVDMYASRLSGSSTLVFEVPNIAVIPLKIIP